LSKWFSPARWREVPAISPFFGVVAAYLVACLVLGGGTRAGFLSDVALQGLAVPLLLWAAWRSLDIPPTSGRRRAWAALVLCCVGVALPLSQLVPLPPSVWGQLPARGDFAENLQAAGLDVGWLPLSVAPSLTWLSALGLLPPMAVFLGVLQLGYADRRRLSLIVLITGLISVGLGLLQVAQGPSSPLRFYAFTNTSEAVGFFANRNHYSALLYCLVLVAAAWSIAVVADATRAGLSFRSRRSTRHMIALVGSFTVLVILVAAQAMARSRAGLGLTIVALLGAFALAYLAPIGPVYTNSPSRTGATTRGARRLLLAAISLATILGIQFALYRIQARFELDPLADARLPFARNTIEAALAYMPFGSGMGTFVPVYQTFEKATDNVASVYANRAHNDFLEFWLEAGVVALFAMAGFVVWLVWASWRAWRRGLPGAGYRDNLLACAAALALLLLLAHATVDYALRTAALMAVFAWAVSMLLVPVGTVAQELDVEGTQERHAKRGRHRGRSTSRPTAPRGEEESPGQESKEPPERPFVPALPRDDWPPEWRPRRPPGRSDE
jgi:hypothetical protein